MGAKQWPAYNCARRRKTGAHGRRAKGHLPHALQSLHGTAGHCRDVMPFLCFFAFLAGFVDAVVGGGGLIQLPALFIFLPTELAASVPVVFGTNKFASFCGTST